MFEELKQYEEKTKIAIEALFFNSTESKLAREHWKILGKEEYGISTHVCIVVGAVKPEGEPLAASCHLKKQLSRSIRRVVELFPNSENETLIWRAYPEVNFQDYREKDEFFELDESSQRVYLYFRISSMPTNARFVNKLENEIEVA